MRVLCLYDKKKNVCMNFVQGFNFTVCDNLLRLDVSRQLPDGFFVLDDKPDEMLINDAVTADLSKVLAVSAIIGNNGSGKTMAARNLGNMFDTGGLQSGVSVIIEKGKEVSIYGAQVFNDISDAAKRLQSLGYRVIDWRNADRVMPPYELIYYTPFCANYKLWSPTVDWRHELSPAAYFDQKTLEESSIVHPNKFSGDAYGTPLRKYNRYLQGMILEFVGDMYANGLDIGAHSSFPMPYQAIIGDERLTTVDLLENLENETAEHIVSNETLRSKCKSCLGTVVNGLKINAMPCTILLSALLLISRIVFSLDDDKFMRSDYVLFIQGIGKFGAFINKRRRVNNDSLAVTWHQTLTEAERSCAYEQITEPLGRLATNKEACSFIHWDKLSVIWKSLIKIAIDQQGDVDDDMMLCSLNDKKSRSTFIDMMLAHSQMDLGAPFINATIANVSSGELSYLAMFARLHQVMKKIGCARTTGTTSSKPKALLLFIDEAETTMHPEWQRQLVSNIIWYIEGFTRNVSAHVIFASHSPILLSDIPNGNVVYLNSHDTNVEEEASSFNTFGANIFDLYRLPFLMTEGLVGRFAAGKINGLLKKIADQLTENEGLAKINIDSDDKALLGMIGDSVINKYLGSLVESGLL